MEASPSPALSSTSIPFLVKADLSPQKKPLLVFFIVDSFSPGLGFMGDPGNCDGGPRAKTIFVKLLKSSLPLPVPFCWASARGFQFYINSLHCSGAAISSIFQWQPRAQERRNTLKLVLRQLLFLILLDKSIPLSLFHSTDLIMPLFFSAMTFVDKRTNLHI